MSNFNDSFVHEEGEAQYPLAPAPRSRRSTIRSPQATNIPVLAQNVLSDSSSSSSPDVPFSVTRTPPSPVIQLSPAFRQSLPLAASPPPFALVSRGSPLEDEEEKDEEKDEFPHQAPSFRPRRHHFEHEEHEENPEICHLAEEMLHHAGSLLVTPPSRAMLTPTRRHPHTPYNSPEVLHLDDDGHSQHEMPEFVTKALILQWNSEIGNSHNVSRATKLIERMRQLGGLDPSPDGGPIDIPASRIGLCLLSGLNNQENKIHALTSLLEILKADNYSKGNSVQLVTLAIQLLRLMNREVMQAVDIDAQTKIAQVYNVLAETLHHHYGKHHINALTEELKEQLIQTAKSIERLNRLEEVELKFQAHCALEGVRRLKDDKQELFDIAERMYHTIVGATQLYLGDASGEAFPELERAFSGLDPHMPTAWYDAILVLKRMARDIQEDPSLREADDPDMPNKPKESKKLTPLLMFIGENYRQLNWKFTYAAVEVLFQLSLHGPNEKIRSRAFNGAKQLGRDFPGLASFIDCHDMNDYTSYKPMVHLERPHTIDPNIRIRHAAIKHVHDLLDHSQDEQIRKKAAFIIRRRERVEEDPHVMSAIQRKNSY